MYPSKRLSYNACDPPRRIKQNELGAVLGRRAVHKPYSQHFVKQSLNFKFPAKAIMNWLITAL
ncbi:MAG: hypothetical protein QW707_08890, partial [Candidatus Bathyarchaeia archaeon]